MTVSAIKTNEGHLNGFYKTTEWYSFGRITVVLTI